MKLKQRVGDFRVRELLDESYLTERGDFRVYRVSKRKLTTPEAMDALAAEAGVDRADVGVAGWKDRQGITVQYMSVPRGRKVRIQAPELKIDSIGFGNEPYSSEHSRGNGFELCVRALTGDDIRRLRRSMPIVREHGLIDYFDDQRFGNLTHGQGWIARELMLGRVEAALRALLTAPGAHDDERRRRFKSALHRSWGDWRACREVAGKFGAHHSIFEHLKKNPDDFAGAFRFVATRVRLIHLFAWQSHLWNRAAADLVRSCTELEDRVLMDSEEGVLVSYADAPPAAITAKPSLRLPGEGLEDVLDSDDLSRFEDVLAREEMVPDQLRIDGIEGWKLKGEDRPLVVHPRHLRVRPAEEDLINRGLRMVRVRFELPRGSYASLVVKRLFALTPKESEARAKQPRQERRERSGSSRSGSWNRGHTGTSERGGRSWNRDRDHGGRRDDHGERGERGWKRGGGAGESRRPDRNRQSVERGNFARARSEGRGRGWGRDPESGGRQDSGRGREGGARGGWKRDRGEGERRPWSRGRADRDQREHGRARSGGGRRAWDRDREDDGRPGGGRGPDRSESEPRNRARGRGERQGWGRDSSREGRRGAEGDRRAREKRSSDKEPTGWKGAKPRSDHGGKAPRIDSKGSAWGRGRQGDRS